MIQEQHRQHLLEQLNRSQLSLFIGADLPREITTLPSRADLVRDLARRHDLSESHSLAEVAQRVAKGGNRWEFTAFIRDTLDTSGKPPQPFHRRTVELVQTYQIKTLITTAYDNLMELAFQEANVPINRVVRGSDVSFITPDRPTLIKLYGDAQQPDTLVVTEDDHYGLSRDRDKEDVLDEVRNVLRKQTVLFLGYNLSDPDFNLLWHEVLDRAGRFARTAYAVWPDLPEPDAQVWRDRGVHHPGHRSSGNSGREYPTTHTTRSPGSNHYGPRKSTRTAPRYG
ncbi:MAG: SIR2 family protein [Chloroflexi bacterium]|nr:SIR2 family protein [Chloroflexota bacterium]